MRWYLISSLKLLILDGYELPSDLLIWSNLCIWNQRKDEFRAWMWLCMSRNDIFWIFNKNTGTKGMGACSCPHQRHNCLYTSIKYIRGIQNDWLWNSTAAQKMWWCPGWFSAAEYHNQIHLHHAVLHYGLSNSLVRLQTCIINPQTPRNQSCLLQMDLCCMHFMPHNFD